MLNDYKYAIGTMKQVGNYNKITTYLILHIRKTYKHGGGIANAIENQKPFNFGPSALKLQISLIVEPETNFNLSAPRLHILSTVETETTFPQDKLEIKHQNDQYKIKYEAELQLHLKQKSHYHMNLGKHTHSYLDIAQQAYSIE